MPKIPEFQAADIWVRRGKRYVILRGRLQGGRVKLAGQYGQVFETPAESFFSDLRFPAARVGRDEALAQRYQEAASRLAGGRREEDGR